MKKLTTGILATLACLCLVPLAGCKDPAPKTGNMSAAKSFLQGMYEAKESGRADYDLTNSFQIGDVTYTVTWSVTIRTEGADASNVVVKPGEGAEGATKIDVNEDSLEEIDYALVATISDPAGNTIEANFLRTLEAAPDKVPSKIKAAPVADTPYKLYMYQSSTKKDEYFTGKEDGYYLGSSTNYKKGVDVYAEAVDGKEGSFYLSFSDPTLANTKQYLGVANVWSNNSWHDNAIYSTSTEVAEGEVKSFEWTYSTEYGTVVSTLTGVKSGSSEDTAETSTETYFLGTSGTYYTFGAMSVENIETYKDQPSHVGYLVEMVSKSSISAETKVATEKAAISTTVTYSGAVNETLAAAGSTYTDVTIAWAVKSGTATIDGTTLTIAEPSAETTVVLTATITCGDVSDTVDVTVTVKPETKLNAVSSPVAETAYKLCINKANSSAYNGGVYYITGEMDSHYLATTEYPTEGADVYVEAATGGYYLYFYKGNTKTYINGILNGDYKNFSLTETPTSVYTYHSETGAWATTIGDTQYYIGTYNAHTTLSFSGLSYIEGDNVSKVGESQFPVMLVLASEAEANGPTAPEGGEDDLPADGTTLTIPEAIEIGEATNGTPTKNKYYTSGKITGFYGNSGTTYGNVYIEDAAGNSILVYGLYSANGETRYDAMETKPVVGDTITVYGVLSSYNGTAQFIDAWMTAHTPGESGGEDGGDDNTDVPSVPSALQENVAYTISASNANGKMWLDGTVSSGRFNGTTSESSAASFYVENVTGGQLLYFLNNNVKTYIVMSDSSSGGSTTTDAAAATIFEWNATLSTLVVADDANNRAFGAGATSTYSNFSCYDATGSYNWGQFTVVGGDPVVPDDGGEDGGDDNTDVPSVTSGLQENVAYTVSASNANGKMWLDGTVSSGRFNGTTSESSAASFYVENVTGGQLLYFLNNNVKTYIVMSDSSTGGSTTTDAAAATIFEWNATLSTLVVADDANNRAFGAGATSTYSNFSCYDATGSYNWGQFTPVVTN